MNGIQEIKLLKGHHADTGVTGQGCFMDVVAYLNGETIITDNSPCVCPILRPMLVRYNDVTTDAQRQLLLPYLLRATGSKTTDFDELKRRMALVVQYAEKELARAADYALYRDPRYFRNRMHYLVHAEKSLITATTFVALSKPYDFRPFAAYIHDVVSDCTKYANSVGMGFSYDEALTEDFLALLDSALPPLEGAPSPVVTARIGELIAAAA